jgi:hypothetical protein
VGAVVVGARAGAVVDVVEVVVDVVVGGSSSSAWSVTLAT